MVISQLKLFKIRVPACGRQVGGYIHKATKNLKALPETKL